MVTPTSDPELLEKQLVWEFFHRSKDGFFVEVGANDPQAGSQTWLLEQNGWHGVLIEPQSALCERLRAERKRSQVFQMACGAPGQQGELSLHVAAANGLSTLRKQRDSHGIDFVGVEKVRVLTLDEILGQAGDPPIDFLSLDVEGFEVEVMRGFSFQKHHPSLILIEDGVRSLEKHRYLTRHNYRLVKRTCLNNWYIPKAREFHMTSMAERARLFRKMYLGLPFRTMRLAIRRRGRAAGNGSA
jgi:FkbM family methyltransferase